MPSCAKAIARYCRSRIIFASSPRRATGPTPIVSTRRRGPISSSWTYRCPALAGWRRSGASGNGTARRASSSFTMHQSAAYAVQAIKAGARGFVTKSNPPEALLRAIDEVMAGTHRAQPRHRPRTRDEPPRRRTFGGSDALSPREFEILQMLLAEKSADDIAETLHISAKTAANTRYLIRAASSASPPTSNSYVSRFASGSSRRISRAKA